MSTNNDTSDRPRRSYFAIIPGPVRYCDDLKPNSKLLYGEITALTNERGYCWASNRYFSELYKVSPKTISSWVTQLNRAGFIRVAIIKDSDYVPPEARGDDHLFKMLDHSGTVRLIFITDQRGHRHLTQGAPLNDGAGHREMTVHNSTREKYIEEVIVFLNAIGSTAFKVGAKGNRKHINARLEEGYTLAELKAAASVKVTQWIGTKDAQYIRPSTIFNSEKFAGYLEQARRDGYLNAEGELVVRGQAKADLCLADILKRFNNDPRLVANKSLLLQSMKIYPSKADPAAIEYQNIDSLLFEIERIGGKL